MSPGHVNRNVNSSARERLHRSAIEVVGREGAGASVRAIAADAGVSEGALYRHYQSREHLLAAVLAELIEPMVAEKETLVAMRAPMRDRLREWVRSTYARFDLDPVAFGYVFLTDLPLPAMTEPVIGRQSALFGELFKQGRDSGELREMPVALASGLFVGLLLSVPKGLRAGRLRGKASRHVDEVSDAVWRVLGAGAGAE